MFLSKISIHSWIIIPYIVEKNIFVIIVYKLLVQKEILKRQIKDCCKINDKQRIIMPEIGGSIKFKNYQR